MGTGRVRLFLGKREVSDVAEVRAIFFGVCLVGHFAGAAGILLCAARSEAAIAAMQSGDGRDRCVCRGLVERSLRGSNYLRGDTADHSITSACTTDEIWKVSL